jgi:hypothetical protein
MVFYYGIFRIFYLLIVGLVLWVIGKVRNMELGYDKYFKIAVHTFTLPLVLDVIIKITNINFVLPFWFFLINVIFGVMVILNLQKAPKEAN